MQQGHNINKVDQSLALNFMDVYGSLLLMLQPDGFTQTQSNEDLRRFAQMSNCGFFCLVFLLLAHQGQILYKMHLLLIKNLSTVLIKKTEMSLENLFYRLK